MTNAEKFKTAEERAIAFRKFCVKKICKGSEANCIFSGKMHDKIKHNCEFAWLDLEYKEELRPCPFCGDEAVIFSVEEGVYCVSCTSDSCIANVATQTFSSEEEAIAAWNRRVK